MLHTFPKGWVQFGSVAEQERRLQWARPMGTWLLVILEAGWSEDDIVWSTSAWEWNNETKTYDVKYSQRENNGYTNFERAKAHIDDWYACNVIAEELMMEREDGPEQQ